MCTFNFSIATQYKHLNLKKKHSPPFKLMVSCFLHGQVSWNCYLYFFNSISVSVWILNFSYINSMKLFSSRSLMTPILKYPRDTKSSASVTFPWYLTLTENHSSSGFYDTWYWFSWFSSLTLNIFCRLIYLYSLLNLSTLPGQKVSSVHSRKPWFQTSLKWWQLPI